MSQVEQPADGSGAPRRSGAGAAIALIVVLVAAGVALAIWQPWKDDAAVTASPSPSVSPSESPSPTPSATEPVLTDAEILAQATVADVLVTVPASIGVPEWTGSFHAVTSWESFETVEESGEPPAFLPDGDYPGTDDLTSVDETLVRDVTGAAPPFFATMTDFFFTSATMTGVGDGTSMDATALSSELLRGSDPERAWLVAAFLTDEHSGEPRWAVCRFAVGVVDGQAQTVAVYCDQADQNTMVDPDPYWMIDWFVEGSSLVEIRASTDAPGYFTEPERVARGFTLVDGEGRLIPEEAPVPTSDAVAQFRPEELGIEVGACLDASNTWICGDI